ncbi:MAG: tape measure protein [Fimbriimonadaceae bacterium]|nr:tape measure protein [Fimbriimonadaceae bacterium]
MATSVNTVIERYLLDASQYVAASRRVTAATGQMAKAAAGARAALSLPGGTASPMARFAFGVRNQDDRATFGSTFGPGVRLAGRAALTGFRVATAALTAELAALTVAARVAFGALEAFGEFEALKRGFENVVGDGREAEKQLKRLREIGRLPGIDFEGAITGSRALQEAGLSAAEAEETLRQFANASALAGMATTETTSALMQLRQALRKGKIDGDELRSVLENVPYAARALKDAFGTSVGAELAAMGVTAKQALGVIVARLAEVPRAADGVKNSLENVRASWHLAEVSIGEGVNTAIGGIGGIATALDDLVEGGAFATLGEKLGAIFATDGVENMTGALGDLTAAFQTLVDWIGIATKETGNYLDTIGAAIPGVGMVKRLLDWATGPVRDTQAKNRSGIETQMDLARTRRDVHAARRMFGEGQTDEAVQRAMPGRDREWIARQRAIWAVKQKEPEREKPFAEDGARRGAAAAMTRLTGAIERNTEASERLGELQRMIFGGGNLGRFGVSPIELGQNRRGRGNSVTITVLGGANELIDTVMRLKRDGVLA